MVVRRVLAAVVGVLLVAYLVMVPLGVIGASARLSTPEIIVAVAVLVLSQYSIEDLTFDTGGASKIRLRRVEDRQRALESDVKALMMALSGIVTKHELSHLRGLDAPGRFEVQYSNHMFRELERLDAMQFVEPVRDGGLSAIRTDHQVPDDRFDLKDYAKITERGQDYLKLLDSL